MPIAEPDIEEEFSGWAFHAAQPRRTLDGSGGSGDLFSQRRSWTRPSQGVVRSVAGKSPQRSAPRRLAPAPLEALAAKGPARHRRLCQTCSTGRNAGKACDAPAILTSTAAQASCTSLHLSVAW